MAAIPAVSETTTVVSMHVPHPVFGDLVTANRLVRGGRWVFRGTIVPLDDVFADIDAGMNLHEIWEKHGTLERADLEAVAARALRGRAAFVPSRVGERHRSV